MTSPQQSRRHAIWLSFSIIALFYIALPILARG
jgi:hypothetical protein